MSKSPILPKYYQVEQSLRRRLAELPLGTALPSEPELSREYGVSRTTLRQAIDALSAEGLVERIQGKGTFVAGRKIDFPLDYEADRGVGVATEAEHRLLVFDRRPAGSELAALFDVPSDNEVLHVERLTLLGGLRMGVGTLSVCSPVTDTLRREDFHHGRFFYTLLDRGVLLRRYRLMIESVVIDPAMADILEVRPGLPGIGLTRHAFDDEGRLVARVSIVTRGDVGRYVLEAPIDNSGARDGTNLTFEMI